MKEIRVADFVLDLTQLADASFLVVGVIQIQLVDLCPIDSSSAFTIFNMRCLPSRRRRCDDIAYPEPRRGHGLQPERSAASAGAAPSVRSTCVRKNRMFISQTMGNMDAELKPVAT